MNLERDTLVEIGAINTLLAMAPGFGVNLFGLISVYRLEDGRYSVSDDVNNTEVLFQDALSAAMHFVSERNRRQIGFDFEKSPVRKKP